MKKSNALTGLPVLAIADGAMVSMVLAPLINQQEGKIAYLLLDGQAWFLEKRVLKFEDIAAIGEDAVTTETAANVKPVSTAPQAVKILQHNTTLINTKVITRDGRLVGTAGEFYFDEKSGIITGCELVPGDGQEPIGVIPAAQIKTYGQSYLVVAEDYQLHPGTPPDRQEVVIPPKPALSQAQEADRRTEESSGEEDPLTLFSTKQRQYLIGKKASRTIIDANSNIIIAEGSVITEDVIERARQVDKYVELTMFVE